MREQQAKTQPIKAADVRQQFASIINRVARKEARAVAEKSGIPVAGIVSADDLRRLDQLDQERAERFNVIDEMRASFRDVPAEEIEREAERTLAEVRAEMRAEREQVATYS